MAKYTYNDCIQEVIRNRNGTEPASIDVLEIPSSNQSIDLPFIVQPEEIQNNVNPEEQLIIPDALPFVGIQEEIKTHISKPTVPKIKIKTLEDLQNCQSEHKIKLNEFYVISEDVNNGSLHYITAQKIHPPNEEQFNNFSTNGNAVLESSENKMKLQTRNLKIRKKEQLLRERLKKVLEMQTVMRIGHNNKNKQNVPSIEKPEPLNFVDVNSNPTLTQSKTVNEFDISLLKDEIIEASRTLISTQKSLKFLAQMLSNHVYLNDKHTAYVLNQFKQILKTFNKRFDKIQKTVKNQYQDVIAQNDINDLLKIIEESAPPVSLGVNADNKTRSSQVSKLGAKPYEISVNKIVNIYGTDIFHGGVEENFNVPLSIADGKTYKDNKNTFSPVTSSVKSEAKKPGIVEWNFDRYEGEKNKPIRVGRPPKEKTYVEKKKSSRVDRPPKEKKYVEKKKYSRVGRPPKVLTKEEKSDKTFCLPGLSRQVDTALKRVVPARSCRQLQSTVIKDGLYFVPDCNT